MSDTTRKLREFADKHDVDFDDREVMLGITCRFIDLLAVKLPHVPVAQMLDEFVQDEARRLGLATLSDEDEDDFDDDPDDDDDDFDDFDDDDDNDFDEDDDPDDDTEDE